MEQIPRLSAAVTLTPCNPKPRIKGGAKTIEAPVISARIFSTIGKVALVA